MKSSEPVLLIATSNSGKLDEYRRILPKSIRLLSLNDVDVDLPAEDGETYQAIAEAKALVAANASGLLTLGDDSGLEVDALQGRPGIHSARFSGPAATDRQNIDKLLREMHSVPGEQRGARFRCAIALARPGRIVSSVEGSCSGSIAFSPAGNQGFGYDPVFLLPDGRSIAQLGPQEKDRRSHRGDAVRSLLPALMKALSLPNEKGNVENND